MLTLAEELILLAIDEEQGTVGCSSMTKKTITYALTGAIIKGPVTVGRDSPLIDWSGKGSRFLASQGIIYKKEHKTLGIISSPVYGWQLHAPGAAAPYPGTCRSAGGRHE